MNAVSFSFSMLRAETFCAGKRMVLKHDNAMEVAIPCQGRSLALNLLSIFSSWPFLGLWRSAHLIFTETTAKRVKQAAFQ